MGECPTCAHYRDKVNELSRQLADRDGERRVDVDLLRQTLRHLPAGEVRDLTLATIRQLGGEP